MSQPYVGEIRLFSFPRVPTGWFACDGSLQSIADYQVLFTLIGTTYGGDGMSTFGLPDLRGSVPLHQGNGLGLSPRVIGAQGGTESVTLITSQMPQHSHQPMVTSNAASSATPSPSLLPGTVGNGDTMYATDLTGGTQATLSPASAIAMQGGNQAHDNQMPTLTVSACIAWAGIFPSRT